MYARDTKTNSEYKSDQLAFTRRLNRIYRGDTARSLEAPLIELHREFEQAIEDHRRLRGPDASTGFGDPDASTGFGDPDASTGFGDDPASIADNLIRFFVSAMIGGYKLGGYKP